MSTAGTGYEREIDISYGSERVTIELINEISDSRPWRNNFKVRCREKHLGHYEIQQKVDLL